MNELEDFNLPEPDTRLVVFGKTVFKIKYKTRYSLMLRVMFAWLISVLIVTLG